MVFVERIVGLPGDRIAVVAGHVVRNGMRQREPYIAPCGGVDECNLPKPIAIPPGHYFFMADNRGAADLLAAYDQWPPLYDVDRLAANEVPVLAAVYFDDMYVDAHLQLETAERVGNVRTWVTNEFEHDGLRADAPRVLGRLFDMRAGIV